jgi:hypothetical protein
LTTRQKPAPHCSLRHDVSRIQVNCTGSNVSLCSIHMITLHVYTIITPGVIGFFRWHNSSDRTMALGSTQTLIEMSTRIISWGLKRPVRKTDDLTTILCRCQENLGILNSWIPLGHSRPVTGLLYLTIITPGNRVLPEKITGSQLVKNFPAFYRTRMFIAAFTWARHLSMSWTRPIQSMPLIPFLIVPLKYYSSIYALVFEVVSGFSKRNPICSYPVSHTCYLPRLSHCPCFDHSNSIRWGAEIILLLVM